MNKKKALLIGAAAVLVFLFALGIFLPDALRNYTVNQTDTESGLEVPSALTLFSGDTLGFSFLYPTGRSTAYNEEDGVYVYPEGADMSSYVLIWKGKGSISPEEHFAKLDDTMEKSFTNVQATPIQQTQVGEKTLYLKRYLAGSDSGELVLDRYIEIYDKCFVQYTAVSDSAGSLNTELYYAISTLKLHDGAYQGTFTETLTQYEHSDMNFSIKLPDMLVTRELTIGYFASNDDAVLLCLNCTEDDSGKAIYNRQDFIDRADESPSFVASVIGADFVSFSNGQKEELGGKEFYCYPMEMVVGSESYSGLLCLANADDSGCFMLCYAVRKDSPNYETISEICEKSCESIRFSN